MLVFRNPGLIDIDAVTTLGVNVKVNDNPIGVFGTGMKYAIAIILRLGGSITVYRGRKAYTFTLRTKNIRGVDVEIVYMNGTKLGFTSRLGINWQPWMAYRELWSNARDEGGSVSSIEALDDVLKLLSADSTTIVVACKALDEVHLNRSTIILNSEPLFESPGVKVHLGESSYIFYKGIRVHEFDKKTSLYTYNLSAHTSLTEDRTLLYPSMVPYAMARGIVQSTWMPFLYDVLSKKATNHVEGNLPYANIKDTKPSPQFMEVSEELHRRKELCVGAESLFKHYQDTMPGYVSPYIVELTAAEQEIFEKARELVLEKLPAPGFGGVTIQFKSKMEAFKITTGKGRMTLDHSFIQKGHKRLAQALLEGLVMTKQGSFGEQMTHFVLFGEFVPDELTEGFGSRSMEFEDMVF